MAYNDKVGLVDYFGGKKHLQKKIISAVLQPDVRFKEDALRILRGLRFASVYDFEIEPQTKESIIKNKDLLLNISCERIYSELVKLLMGQGVEKILLEFSQVFATIIPELADTFGFLQHNPYHKYDVYTHTVKAISSSKNSKVVRLALLFHDIGKPETFTVDKNGVGHFYAHAAKSCDIARVVLNRLRVDGKTKAEVLKLIKYHDAVINPDEKTVKRWLNKLGIDSFENLIHLKYADNLAQSGKELTTRLESYDKIFELCRQISEQKQCFDMKSLEINGYDLINIGMSPGAGVGKLLKEILYKVVDGELENNKSNLVLYAKKYIKDNDIIAR